MDICEKIKQNLDLQSDIITDRPTHKHIPKKNECAMHMGL